MPQSPCDHAQQPTPPWPAVLCDDVSDCDAVGRGEICCPVKKVCEVPDSTTPNACGECCPGLHLVGVKWDDGNAFSEKPPFTFSADHCSDAGCMPGITSGVYHLFVLPCYPTSVDFIWADRNHEPRIASTACWLRDCHRFSYHLCEHSRL